MELAGGLLLGGILMFSLLAFSPDENAFLSRVFRDIFSVATSSQTAHIGATIVPMEKEQTQALALTSPSFLNDGALPKPFTCDAVGISPALSISGVPKDTQSLVVLMDDPDAVGGTWVHWLAFNIPPTTRSIPEGTEPPGRPGKNSWGTVGYGAACPPAGTGEHRYFFHLYALNRALSLAAGSSAGEVRTAMNHIILAEATLVARYKREKK